MVQRKSNQGGRGRGHEEEGEDPELEHKLLRVNYKIGSVLDYLNIQKESHCIVIVYYLYNLYTSGLSVHVTVSKESQEELSFIILKKISYYSIVNENLGMRTNLTLMNVP